MARFFSNERTSIIRSEEELGSHENLLKGSSLVSESSNQKRNWTAKVIFSLINVVVCVTTVIFAITLQGPRPVFETGPQDSIVFGELDLRAIFRSGNKSQWSSDEVDSIYIRPPSAEVDEAWNKISLENQEMTTITSVQALALGYDLDLLAKVPEDWGLGKGRYFAQVEVFHLIHCLDEIRKQIYYDHYHFSKFGKTPPPEFINHKNHCMHMLLENLLCQSSSNIIVHNWRETYHVPLADFNAPRECRDFDALIDWGSRHAIPNYRSKWAKLDIPPEGVILPAPTPRLY